MSLHPKLPDDLETSWTLIHSAADGSASARNAFAKRYESLVRHCLQARWRHGQAATHIDDAIQEVFIQCIRPGGVLSRVDPSREGGFRCFFRGVIRNVILRFETKHRDASLGEIDVVEGDDSVSRVFDREYAKSVMAEAMALQRRLAMERGDQAIRRIELLDARFQENLPIRKIAERWGVETAWLHHQYAKAREEFRDALMQVVAASQPAANLAENTESCRELLSLL
jgi:RNA polymerase sigma factor (sigma-70 family)